MVSCFTAQEKKRQSFWVAPIIYSNLPILGEAGNAFYPFLDYIKDPSGAFKYDIIMTFVSPTIFFLLFYACSKTKFCVASKLWAKNLPNPAYFELDCQTEKIFEKNI